MMIYTVNQNFKNRNIYVLDVDFYRKNFLSPIHATQVLFYKGSISYEEALQRYFAELHTRYYEDAAPFSDLMSKNAVAFTDQAPSVIIERQQSPRHMAAAYFVHFLGATYYGNI